MGKAEKFYISVFCIFIMTSCATKYTYRDIKAADKVYELSSLVVAVENTANMDYGWGSPPRPPSDLASLVSALQTRGIFKEINYIGKTSREPDLIISRYRDTSAEFRGLHGEKGGFFCNPFLSTLTLFIIPLYCDSEEVVEFYISTTNGAKTAKVSFKRSNATMIGLFSGVMLLNPNWETDDFKSVSVKHSKKYNNYAVNKIIENKDIFINLLSGSGL